MSKLDANWRRCRVCRSMMYDPTRCRRYCRGCKERLAGAALVMVVLAVAVGLLFIANV